MSMDTHGAETCKQNNLMCKIKRKQQNMSGEIVDPGGDIFVVVLINVHDVSMKFPSE